MLIPLPRSGIAGHNDAVPPETLRLIQRRIGTPDERVGGISTMVPGNTR